MKKLLLALALFAIPQVSRAAVVSYIQLKGTLQTGATFYVSSGTATNFNTTTLKFADGTTQTTGATSGVTTTSTSTWTANQIFSSATVTTLNTTTMTPTFIVGATNGSNKPAGDVGFYLSTTTQAGGQSFPTSTNYGDIVSTGLAPGNWLIFANITAELNGATVTSWQGGVSTTSGNSSTGLTIGQTLFFARNPTSNERVTLAMMPIYVQITVQTTYYLKINANYATATPIEYGGLTAIRMP